MFFGGEGQGEKGRGRGGTEGEGEREEREGHAVFQLDNYYHLGTLNYLLSFFFGFLVEGRGAEILWSSSRDEIKEQNEIESNDRFDDTRGLNE